MKKMALFMKNYKKQLYMVFFAVLIVAFTAIFIDLLEDLKEAELRAFDHNVIAYIQGHVSARLTAVMKVITFFGGKVWLIAAVLVISLVVGLKKRRYGFFLLLTSATGSAFNLMLKNMIQRERPDIFPIIEESGYSFPSGHSMGSLIFYATLAIILAKISRRKWVDSIIIAFFVLLVLAIGISRIYLGVHYPSDVIGGYTAGAFWVLICWFIFDFYEERTKK
ncbi:phosphatase PAP2 family protein [Bacillus testis]|uniref:phosphatase PAP2 family protein n=1 Tax=Bacillus testis TaxID=1622072 RepID=UPI00067E8A7C|nr:phosphatase PAP2 family protein [Bacillus testis]